eukprot:Selendium_serpulae@DN909_c0_g1_i1.p1
MGIVPFSAFLTVVRLRNRPRASRESVTQSVAPDRLWCSVLRLAYSSCVSVCPKERCCHPACLPVCLFVGGWWVAVSLPVCASMSVSVNRPFASTLTGLRRVARCLAMTRRRSSRRWLPSDSLLGLDNAPVVDFQTACQSGAAKPGAVTACCYICLTYLGLFFCISAESEPPKPITAECRNRQPTDRRTASRSVTRERENVSTAAPPIN